MNEGMPCECISVPQTVDHLFRCPLLGQECRAADLAEFNDRAKDCVQLWLNAISSMCVDTIRRRSVANQNKTLIPRLNSRI